MADKASMVLINDICQNGVCKKLASYRVYTRHSDLEGQYCEEHATSKVEALNAYYEVTDAHYAKAQNKGKPDVLLVGPSGGPYVPDTRRSSGE